jgi:hypothetical protein
MKLTKTDSGLEGNTLLVTLLTASIIGVALGSHLTLVSFQNRAVLQSQAWDACIPVLEAGIEEALTQIHYSGLSNLSANGWSLGLDGCFHKKRAIGDGSYCEVTIAPVDPPTIVSDGYVPSPLSSSSQIGMVFGQIVSGYSFWSNPRYVRRRVKIETRKASSQGGLAAKGRITFTGGGSFDSFDSSDPRYSTGGNYDPTKRKAGAIAVTNSKQSNAIMVETARLYGSVVTGPGGTINVSSGAVGDIDWNANNSGIQPGHSANDANVEFLDLRTPFTSGYFTPGGGLLGGISHTYLLGDGNYQLGAVNLGTGGSMLVNGNATLFVDGDFTTSDLGYVYIAPGARLKIYVSGRFTVSGAGVINGTQRAENFSIYGLNTCTTVNYSGASALIGTVYAPSAAFDFSGQAGAFGAFVASTVSIRDGADVHYDEAVKAGLGQYVVASWNEL